MHLVGFKSDSTNVSSDLSTIRGLGRSTNWWCTDSRLCDQAGLRSYKYVLSALVDMYGKCECTFKMLRVLDQISDTDLGVFALTKRSC